MAASSALTPSMRLSLLAAAAAVAFLAGCAAAHAGDVEPLLPALAFQPVARCASIDPFTDRSPAEGDRSLACNPDRPWQLAVRTPRVRPTDTGPSRVEVDIDRQVGLRGAVFSGSARLRMAAASDGPAVRLQPRQTLLAAKGTMHLGELLSLDLGIGHDIYPTSLMRTTATATYRATRRHLFYLHVSAMPDSSPVPSLGVHWQLVPGRTSLDLSARRHPDGTVIEPRLGLRWTGG